MDSKRDDSIASEEGIMQRKISAEEKAKVALAAMQGNLTRSGNFIEVWSAYHSD